MVFKQAKEGRSQKLFLSALLTTADKQLLLAHLETLHPASAEGPGVTRSCHGGLWQLDRKLIGSLVGVLAHGHRCDTPDKELQWVSNNHEVAFPCLISEPTAK